MGKKGVGMLVGIVVVGAVGYFLVGNTKHGAEQCAQYASVWSDKARAGTHSEAGVDQVESATVSFSSKLGACVAVVYGKKSGQATDGSGYFSLEYWDIFNARTNEKIQSFTARDGVGIEALSSATVIPQKDAFIVGLGIR